MKSETKTFETESESLNPDLRPEEIDLTPEEIRGLKTCGLALAGCLLPFLVVNLMVWAFSTRNCPPKIQVPEIKIVSMDFTAEINNNNTMQQTHHLPLVSARWDLLIRVPGELVGNYTCLQGNLQASFLYKNVTLVTSSIRSYNKLELGTPQLLNVSAVASEEDLSGAIGKEIMEAIKEKSELRFGSRLTLTDCREETTNGTMSYECDETALRFQPGSDRIKATAFRNHPTCIIDL